MKTTILIHQANAARHFPDLDFLDLAIFEYMKDFQSNAEKIVNDAGVWFWVSNDKIMSDLPCLKIKSRQGIINRVNKLVEANILVRHPDAKSLKRSYFKFVPESIDKLLLTTVNENVQSSTEPNECKPDLTVSVNENVQSTVHETLQDSSIKEDNSIKDKKDLAEPSSADSFFSKELNLKKEILNTKNKKENQEKSSAKKEKVAKLQKEINGISKGERPFVTDLLEVFKEEHKKRFGVEYFEKDMDFKYLVDMQKRSEANKPDFARERRLAAFRDYFESCMNVDDNFLLKKMSPATLETERNQFSKLLKSKLESKELKEKRYTYNEMSVFCQDSGTGARTQDRDFIRHQDENGVYYTRRHRTAPINQNQEK